ncbi:uncharacterized protein LOC117182566 [Belonocnema kinseyi]|uniref:uncharacterized protein LOC117182566 n=1 Tax=Belonocnema kinseyi TaxID=2817044 RepID=UPI00143DBFFF|nr:uncharacterized protein LOC117182566 [Belonocnema kinseyi]
MKKKLKRLREKDVSERQNTKKFHNIYKKLPFVQRQFLDMLLRNFDKDLQGRRYTQEEKIICLSIYKRSAKSYRYMRTFLPLPSPTSLKILLRKIQLDAGVNDDPRRRLKEAAKGLTEKDKVMILMWDELLLGTGLFYDKELDKIIGFEDWGNVRTDEFADHALVFMLRSVNTGNKIPVSFCFCSKQTTTSQLLYSIKEVIGAAKDAGFNIVASICDGGSSNQSALNTLIQDTVKLKGEEYVYTNGTYIVHGMEIIPLYDPPHLIKCLRNNLLNKDLELWYNEGKPESARTFAEWNHVITAYEIDVYGTDNRRYVPNLTDRHVYPEKN